jgi:hypothetical protein
MRRKPLPNALDIDLRGGLTDKVTPHAGVALLIDALRRAGVPTAAQRHLPAKRSPKGLDQGRMTEAFVLLSALGGECLDDFEHLRRDRGLAALTGYTLPAAPTARQWLDRFHEPALLADRPAQGAFIRGRLPTGSRSPIPCRLDPRRGSSGHLTAPSTAMRTPGSRSLTDRGHRLGLDTSVSRLCIAGQWIAG